MSRIAGSLVCIAVLPLVATGASPAARIQTIQCHVRGNRAALCRFVDAFNAGAASQLLAPKKEFHRYKEFQRYTVAGPSGTAARNRGAATAYLADRRRHSERLA